MVKETVKINKIEITGIFRCGRCGTEFPKLQFHLSDSIVYPTHCVNPKCKETEEFFLRGWEL